MTNIPLENQRFPVNLVERIEHDIAQGKGVSGDILLGAIEQSAGHTLDARGRNIVRKFSIAAAKRRGRPSNCKGREDFAMEELDAQYTKLLSSYKDEAAKPYPQRSMSSRTAPPSERAFQTLARAMAKDFGNIDWLALRNKHCKWKKGHFHSANNHVDSEDYDAEIERLFPAPPES